MKIRHLLLFILTCTVLNAKIIEVNSINEIKPYLEKKHLVIFDLDNTVMEPIQELGSDQWFYYYFNSCKEQGFSKNEALYKSLKHFIAIQSFTKMQLVEKQVKDIIDSLQGDSVSTMAMTTRDIALSICTLNQLRELKIDFRKTAPSQKELYQNKEGNILFKNGVLFTSGTHKGKALLSTLKMLGFEPRSIIFINDKRENIEPVEQECKRKGVEFTGLRYGYLDSKVANFNKDIAEIQHKHFGQILSNEEAKKLLKNVG